MKTDTKITHLGRNPEKQAWTVSAPVYHASTIVFPTVEELTARDERPGKQVTYGLHGTPTTFNLEDSIACLEGGYDTRLMPSGLAAISILFMAYLTKGGHLLVTDSVYGPTRRFCDQELTRWGVETTYYDPLIGGGIAELIQDNTQVVFVESPGSQTFEIQDIPAIAEAAHKAGALVMMDNAWATPLFYKPFEHGVDVSIQPVTKYISGHSDVMMGAATATKEALPRLHEAILNYGINAAPDDCYLVLRGLRTLSVRLERHQANGLKLAHWLAGRDEVETVLHPAMDSCPGHEIWKRDYTGSSGLFSIVLKPFSKDAVAAMLDHMELFDMGYSWGGFESLIMPYDPSQIRTATAWNHKGPTIRIHAGLEDADDLIEDLKEGFMRLKAVG